MDPARPEPTRPPPPLPYVYRGTLASYRVPTPVRNGFRGRDHSDLEYSENSAPKSPLHHSKSHLLCTTSDYPGHSFASKESASIFSSAKEHTPVFSRAGGDKKMTRHRRSSSGGLTGLKPPGTTVSPSHRRSSSWGVGPIPESARIVNSLESPTAESPYSYQFVVGREEGPSVLRSPVACKSPSAAKHPGRERRRVHFGSTTVLTRAGLPMGTALPRIEEHHPPSTARDAAGNRAASPPLKKRPVHDDASRTIMTLSLQSPGTPARGVEVELSSCFSRVDVSLEKVDCQPLKLGVQEKGGKVRSRSRGGSIFRSGLEAAGRFLLGGRKRTHSSDSSAGPLHVSAPSYHGYNASLTEKAEEDKNSQHALDNSTEENMSDHEECNSRLCNASHSGDTSLESISHRLLQENAAVAKGESMEYHAMGGSYEDGGNLPVSCGSMIVPVSEKSHEGSRHVQLPKVLKHQSLVALTTNGQLLAAAKRHGRWELHEWDGSDLRNSSDKPADIHSGPLPPACMFFLLCPHSKPLLGFRSVVADSMALHAPQSISLPESFIGWSVQDAELWSIVPVNGTGQSTHLDSNHYGWDDVGRGLWEGPVVLENCRYPERKLHISVWGLNAGATSVWEQPAAIWAPAGALIPMMHQNMPQDDCKTEDKEATLALPASEPATGCTDLVPASMEEDDKEETELPALAPPFWPAGPKKISSDRDVIKYGCRQSPLSAKSSAGLLPMCLSPLRTSASHDNLLMGIPRSPRQFTVVNPFFPTTISNHCSGSNGLGAPPFWPTASTAVMRSPRHRRSRSHSDIAGDGLLDSLSPGSNSKAVLFLVKKCQAMEAEVRQLRHLMAKAAGIEGVSSGSSSPTFLGTEPAELALSESEYAEEQNAFATHTHHHRHAQFATAEFHQQHNPHGSSLPPRHTSGPASRKTQNHSSNAGPRSCSPAGVASTKPGGSARSAPVREDRTKFAPFREATNLPSQPGRSVRAGTGERSSSSRGVGHGLNGKSQARNDGNMVHHVKKKGGKVAANGGMSLIKEYGKGLNDEDVLPPQARGRAIWNSPGSVKAVWGSPGGSSIGTPEDSLFSFLTSPLGTPPRSSSKGAWTQGGTPEGGADGDIIIDARDLPSWSKNAEEVAAAGRAMNAEMHKSFSSETNSSAVGGGEEGSHIAPGNSGSSSHWRNDMQERQSHEHDHHSHHPQGGKDAREDGWQGGCHGRKDVHEGLQKTGAITMHQGVLEDSWGSGDGGGAEQQQSGPSGNVGSETDAAMADVINNLAAITIEVKAKTARQRATCAANSYAASLVHAGASESAQSSHHHGKPLASWNNGASAREEDELPFRDGAEEAAAAHGAASTAHWLQWMTRGGSLERSKGGGEFGSLVEKVVSPTMRTPPATTWEALFLQRVMGSTIQRMSQEKLGASSSLTANNKEMIPYEGAESDDDDIRKHKHHHKEEHNKHSHGDGCQMLECCHGHAVVPLDILNRGVRFAKGVDSPTMSEGGDSFLGAGGISGGRGRGVPPGELNSKLRSMKRNEGGGGGEWGCSGDMRRSPRSPLNVMNGNVLPQNNNASGGPQGTGRSGHRKGTAQFQQGRSFPAENGHGGMHGGMAGGKSSSRQRSGGQV